MAVRIASFTLDGQGQIVVIKDITIGVVNATTTVTECVVARVTMTQFIVPVGFTNPTGWNGCAFTIGATHRSLSRSTVFSIL